MRRGSDLASLLRLSASEVEKSLFAWSNFEFIVGHLDVTHEQDPLL